MQDSCIQCEYHSPLIRKEKIVNIYVNIPLCIYHSVHQILYVTYQKPQKNLSNGVYSLKCNTHDRIYVGQTGSISK